MTKDNYEDKKRELKDKFKEICKKSFMFFNRISGDLSVFIGLCLINTACYEVNKVLGLIVSGCIFITLGYLINSNKRGDK